MITAAKNVKQGSRRSTNKIKCRLCTHEIVGSRRKYCSDACYWKDMNNRNKARYHEARGIKDKSRVCYSCKGELGKLETDKDKYCSECKKLPVSVRRGF